MRNDYETVARFGHAKLAWGLMKGVDIMNKLFNAISITMIIIIGMVAEVATAVLGLMLPAGIMESLMRFGVPYGWTQVAYWVAMPTIIVIMTYFVITITIENVNIGINVTKGMDEA